MWIILVVGNRGTQSGAFVTKESDNFAVDDEDT